MPKPLLHFALSRNNQTEYLQERFDSVSFCHYNSSSAVQLSVACIFEVNYYRCAQCKEISKSTSLLPPPSLIGWWKWQKLGEEEFSSS